MGKCRHCGIGAGFLRKSHRRCRKTFEEGKRKIREIVTGAILCDAAGSLDQFDAITQDTYIGPATLQKCIEEGWAIAVAKSLEMTPITTDEERVLIDFANTHIQLEDPDLDPDIVDTWNLLHLAISVRELREGRYRTISEESIEHVPINFNRSEDVVYVFSDVQLWKKGTIVIPPAAPVSTYRPLSPIDMTNPLDRFRYRVGQSTHYTMGSRPAYSFQTWQFVTVGYLVTTTQHIYYVDDDRGLHTIKIPLKGIVAVTLDPDDGIAISLHSGENYAFKDLLDDNLTTSLILLLARSA